MSSTTQGELTAIKTLLARIAELEQAQRWIPVSERLPDYDVPVLVISVDWPDRIYSAMRVDEDEGWMWAQASWHGALNDPGNFECDDDYQYSHWMPLPAPPKQEVSDD